MTTAKTTSPHKRFTCRTALFALASAGLALACSPTSAPKAAGSSRLDDRDPAESEGENATGSKQCTPTTAIDPQLAATSAISIPASNLWIQTEIPVSRIQKEIARQVPKTLASERDRPVGAPGKATFTVKRGWPSLHENKKGLEVRVPISADISVCKPIGSACFKYGSCSPRLEARFSVGTHLSKGFELAPPRGSIRATKRCVIGIDVTSHIESIARKEVANVERQIRRQWPDLRPLAERAWQHLKEPLTLAPNECVHFSPKSLSYFPPRIVEVPNERAGKVAKKNKVVKAALGLKGPLTPAESCSDALAPPPLPNPQSKSKSNKTKLWVPERLPLELLQAELAKSLNGPWNDRNPGSLVVLETRLGKKKLALLLKLEGSHCGTVWVTAQWRHKPGAEALSLRDWKLLTTDPHFKEGATPAEPTELESSLLPYLQERGGISLKSATWFSADHQGKFKREISKMLPPSVAFSINDFRAGQARVLASDDGLYLLHPVSAEITVTDF